MKNEKGITLIALVITIIVMLILVTVTIRVATDGALFTHAANAAKGTKAEVESETAILNGNIGNKTIESIVAEQTGGTTGENVTNPYPENTWAKAWTYSSTNKWSNNPITDNSTQLTGDIAAKAYEVTGGYHLVIEKIGSSGEMGELRYASTNTSKKIAEYTPYVNDSLKLALTPAIPKAPHAWQTEIKNQIVVLTICDGVTSIPSYAFDSCSNLKTATIPSTVTSIGDAAFFGCTSLTSVQILSNTITEMTNTFSGCTSLTTVSSLPSSLTNMVGMFGGCTSLTTVPNIPTSVTNMSGAFQGCTSLTTAPNIPTSVTDLEFTFKDCTGLTVIPKLWERVTDDPEYYNGIPDGRSCFAGCSSTATNYSEIPDYWK